MRLRRHPFESKRLRNILLVGSKEREDFLEYLDINRINKTISKNYRWKNRNIMNIPTGLAPRFEVIHKTDIIIYFVNTRETNNLELLMEYFYNHMHVQHHLIVCNDFEKDFRKLKKSEFYKEINKYTDVNLYDSDYEEVEDYIRVLTKKV